MRRSFLSLTALAALLTCAAEPVKVVLNGHEFTLPGGMTIELAAATPLVDRPITAAFDEQGRLYVGDSSGSNEKVEEQLKKKPHRIVRLEDTDGDGRFDRRTVFADNMMFPEGTMWYNGSLYVAAPPSIWKLTDTDGDGVADERVEWFQGKTLTGCANDLHGPYLGPDGWIYWCKGAFAEQTYERPGKKPFVTRAAHIFRCRPDGSGLEPVMTGGMDNPVDVVFTPGGERIFTTTFLVRPGGGQRDGLIHAIYGGVYGKDNDPIYQHPWTGPTTMPVMTHLGPAAPAGLVRYENHTLGRDYQNNLFACLFNMHKITRHILEPSGATFKTKDSDFLVSNNLDFHPTDIVEDADGSLLVVDTGGWYKLCCPTSQLHKPDILGAIYRVRRQDAAKVADPRGLNLKWQDATPEELCQRLGDERPAVRERATQTLAVRGPAVLPDLRKSLEAERPFQERLQAVWTATRIDHDSARAIVRGALQDKDETVVQAALHSISVWRDQNALDAVEEIADWSGIRRHGAPGRRWSSHNMRAAAEVLGRLGIPRANTVDVLLQCAMTNDRVLEHSGIYALIELNATGDLTNHLTTQVSLSRNNNARTNRAALIALDQMTEGNLQARKVIPYLTITPDTQDKRVLSVAAEAFAQLRDTAAWIVTRHPEWGNDLVEPLRVRLETAEIDTPEERAQLTNQLARFGQTPAIQNMLADQLRDPKARPALHRVALQAMARAQLKDTPPVWVDVLPTVLNRSEGDLLREAVHVARSLNLPKQKPVALIDALSDVGSSRDVPADVRLGALAAVPGGLTKVSADVFALLRANVQADQPVTTRGLAADVLARSRLTDDQLQALTDTVKQLGPMELNKVLDAYANRTSESVGQSLLASLKTAAARSTLRSETLKPRLVKYSPAVQKVAEELYAQLEVDTVRQRAKLEEMLGGLSTGDIRRGQAIFQSQKAACIACHAIGYMGGKLGPDLTRIGSIRQERDLLEAIVFPSASFVRSYEPVTIATKDGKVFNGLVKKDAPDEMILSLNADQEVRVLRSDIEEMRPGSVSIMPAGLDQQLTPQELADLVAFLRACR